MYLISYIPRQFSPIMREGFNNDWTRAAYKFYHLPTGRQFDKLKLIWSEDNQFQISDTVKACFKESPLNYLFDSLTQVVCPLENDIFKREQNWISRSSTEEIVFYDDQSYFHLYPVRFLGSDQHMPNAMEYSTYFKLKSTYIITKISQGEIQYWLLTEDEYLVELIGRKREKVRCAYELKNMPSTAHLENKNDFFKNVINNIIPQIDTNQFPSFCKTIHLEHYKMPTTTMKRNANRGLLISCVVGLMVVIGIIKIIYFNHMAGIYGIPIGIVLKCFQITGIFTLGAVALNYWMHRDFSARELSLTRRFVHSEKLHCNSVVNGQLNKEESDCGNMPQLDHLPHNLG